MIKLTRERLANALRYDAESGKFFWLTAPNGRVRIGQVAGSLNSDGYTQIRIDKVHYGAHRLAWMYVHGAWPTQEIDHVNGVRDDNRLVNLRIADRRQQMANLKKPVTNTSGFKGVCFYRKTSRWRASIQRNGKQAHLGYFDSPQEAHAAYCAAAIQKSAEYARAE